MADDTEKLKEAERRAVEATKAQQPQFSDAIRAQALEATKGAHYEVRQAEGSSMPDQRAPLTEHRVKHEPPRPPAYGINPDSRTSVTNQGTPPLKASEQMKPNPAINSFATPQQLPEASQQRAPNGFAPPRPEPQQGQSQPELARDR